MIGLFVELHKDMCNVKNFLTTLLLFILDTDVWSAFLVGKKKWNERERLKH